jgi:RNase P subunit RPR2
MAEKESISYERIEDLEEEKEKMVRERDNLIEYLPRLEKRIKDMEKYIQGEGKQTLCDGCGKIIGHTIYAHVRSPQFPGESGYLHYNGYDGPCHLAWAKKHNLKVKNPLFE